MMALLPQHPTPFNGMIISYQLVLSTLLVAKVHAPQLYLKALKGDLEMPDLASGFRLLNADPQTVDREPYLLRRAWAVFLDQDNAGDRHGWNRFDPRWPLDDPKEELRTLIRDHLETFTLPPAIP